MAEDYKGQYRDRRIAVGAGVALAIVGGVAGVNKLQESDDTRSACVDVTPKQGESGPMLVNRVEKALEPAGETVVFKNVDGKIVRSDEGFPSYKGSQELDLVDQVAFEHANEQACRDIGGIVMPEIVEIDKQ